MNNLHLQAILFFLISSFLKYPAFIRYAKEKYYEAYRKFFWLLNQERR